MLFSIGFFYMNENVRIDGKEHQVPLIHRLFIFQN